MTVDADIYVAADSLRPPAGYEDTHTDMLTDAPAGERLEIYRHRVPAGSVQSVHGGLVAVQEATTMDPAYDTKPVMTYKAADARHEGDTTEWRIAVGIGDEYSLALKYRWPGAAPGPGRLEIRMEDGTLIREQTVELKPAANGKWNYLNSTTGTMINAGHYLVRLIAPPEIAVGDLRVQ